MLRKKTIEQNPLQTLSPEKIYQFLAQKKWSELIDLLHAYYKIIPSDYGLEAAFRVVESELVRNFEEFRQDEKFERNIRNLYLLHQGKLYLFSKSTEDKLIVELAIHFEKKGDIKQAYDFASKLPSDIFCAGIIEKYEQTLPEVVTHPQSQKIYVTQNKNISTTNHTISLFKSNQEYDFFMAVIQVFPMYMVYPNVALSTLISFDKIQAFLSSDEKKYFFTAVIDCVVFDQYKEYIPLYFFELDSSLHDDDGRRKRDKMKNNILAAAGQRLYRVRKLSNLQGQKEFVKLISEVVLQQ